MRIFVSAGEVSGDVHGAYLVSELKKLRPGLNFFGMGSENLRAQAVDIRLDISRRGTVGLIEALPNLFSLYSSFNLVKSILRKERPDLVILIDSQGFNVPLAKFCKRIGLRTIYYISPQEWLWGTPRGVRNISRTVDLILAIFEDEYRAYKSACANVSYFGHPLIDIVKPSMKKEDFLRNVAFPGAPPRRPVIALCPGSRLQEVGGLLPVLLEAGAKLQSHFPSAKFILPVASTNIINDIFDKIGDFRPKAIVGHTYDILASSDLAICASGTINLEASILGVPNIMVYKLSYPTYFIGKYILRIGEKLPYFSMPNLLLKKWVVPELVMKEATADNIVVSSLSILENPSHQDAIKSSFSDLRRILGNPGVIHKCAQRVIDFLDTSR